MMLIRRMVEAMIIVMIMGSHDGDDMILIRTSIRSMIIARTLMMFCGNSYYDDGHDNGHLEI